MTRTATFLPLLSIQVHDRFPSMCDMVAGCTERYEFADGVNLIEVL